MWSTRNGEFFPFIRSLLGYLGECALFVGFGKRLRLVGQVLNVLSGVGRVF